MQTQRKSMTPCTHIRWAFKKWLFWYSVGYFENGRWVSAMIVGDLIRRCIPYELYISMNEETLYAQGARPLMPSDLKGFTPGAFVSNMTWESHMETPE